MPRKFSGHFYYKQLRLHFFKIKQATLHNKGKNLCNKLTGVLLAAAMLPK
jgi:hypothetical protein